MANELRTEVEQVKQKEDVKHALKQTSTVKAHSGRAGATQALTPTLSQRRGRKEKSYAAILIEVN